jgi:Na+/H+-translocating membrane pyrophosphatase
MLGFNYVIVFIGTVLHFSVCALVYSAHIAEWILRKDRGSMEMIKIAEYITEGSEGFFSAQYGTIFRLSFVFAVIIFMRY